jgi:hypothetical protein
MRPSPSKKMSTNTSPLNPDADPNILEMSEEQIAPIDLSNWPKKIRVRLRRSNAYGDQLHPARRPGLGLVADSKHQQDFHGGRSDPCLHH